MPCFLPFKIKNCGSNESLLPQLLFAILQSLFAHRAGAKKLCVFP
jgi:hypothetical protein